MQSGQTGSRSCNRCHKGGLGDRLTRTWTERTSSNNRVLAGLTCKPCFLVFSKPTDRQFLEMLNVVRPVTMKIELLVLGCLLQYQGREGAASVLSGAVPISFGFRRFKGLGWRSIGCQSWRKIPELCRTAIECLFISLHLYPVCGSGILTEERSIRSSSEQNW